MLAKSELNIKSSLTDARQIELNIKSSLTGAVVLGQSGAHSAVVLDIGKAKIPEQKKRIIFMHKNLTNQQCYPSKDHSDLIGKLYCICCSRDRKFSIMENFSLTLWERPLDRVVCVSIFVEPLLPCMQQIASSLKIYQNHSCYKCDQIGKFNGLWATF